MEKRTIGILATALTVLLLFGTVIVRGGNEATRVIHATRPVTKCVSLHQTLEPGESLDFTIDLKGFRDVQITYNVDCNQSEVHFGWCDPEGYNIWFFFAEEEVFRHIHTPIYGTLSFKVGGEKLTVHLANTEPVEELAFHFIFYATT